MFSVDLRMAPFVSWINDLSLPDTIGTIAGFQIHVLPLLMTGVSVLQARSTPKDPRQAAMTTMMPVIFLFLFYNMPSGLVLYWTVMNAMAWGQQAMMNRGDAKVKAVAEAADDAAGGAGGTLTGGDDTKPAGPSGPAINGGASKGATGDGGTAGDGKSDGGAGAAGGDTPALAVGGRSGGRHRKSGKRRRKG
jgi:hypothetical protein